MIRGDAMVGIEAIGRLKETIRRLSDLPRAIAVEAKPGLDKLLRAEFTGGTDPYGRPWDPLYRTRVAPRRVLPQYGLPIAWKKVLRDAARRCARRAVGR
jgi:hypothetical protein